jgi:transcriptional regulator with XRE-family HTH domain
MSEPQTLGDLIRERRLALGFSAGQLAMRLHSTAAVVRTWERGHEPVPDDALADLAELLALDESDLRALQPTPDAGDSDEAPAVVEDVATSEEASSAASIDEPGDDADGDALEDSETSPNGSRDERRGVVGHTPGLAVDTGLLEAPTEAIEPVRPVATTTKERPEAQPALVTRPPAPAVGTSSVEPAAVEVDGTVPDWLGPLQVVFDPSKRYLYWARWVGTAIGLYILFRVLGFALDEALEAIGDFWDSFSTPEPAGEEPAAGVDALTRLVGR